MAEKLKEEMKWDQIIKRIEEEKCILILGPDLALEGKQTMNEQLKDYLDNNSARNYKYYIDDEFYSFFKPTDKIRAFFDVQDFFSKLEYTQIHKKIAEIPFHLIISVSPDLRIRKAFEDSKIDYLFDFYNKEEAPQVIGKPTRIKPLIYNLFGNLDVEGSLIFTYNDLFDYLIAIFGTNQLHKDLRSELQKSSIVLFIGFKFEKWYFKLLLRLLYENKDKLSHAAVNDFKNYFFEDGEGNNLHQAELYNCVETFYSNEYEIGFFDLSGEEIINNIYERFSQKNELRKKQKAQAETAAEIYLSYGWGGENELIVDKIYQSFKDKGYNIIRDKIDLGYKGNIKDFMQSIGKGKYVISVISDKYLKSENCMYEMLEIKNRGKLNECIFPVVMRDAGIYDELQRIDYLKYWDDKLLEIKAKLLTITDPVGTGSIVEKINQYTDIRRVIGEVTDILRNMNIPEMSPDSDFKPLFDAIDKKIKEDIERS